MSSCTSFSHTYVHYCALPSFPTRRSSDLPLRVLGRHVPAATGVGVVRGGRGDDEDVAGTRGTQVGQQLLGQAQRGQHVADRKSTRLNSSHVAISYAVFCLKKKNRNEIHKR